MLKLKEENNFKEGDLSISEIYLNFRVEAYSAWRSIKKACLYLFCYLELTYFISFSIFVMTSLYKLFLF